MTQENDVYGLILAGGKARRMGGGDKALMKLAGRPLLQHAIERARPQVRDLIINANGDGARFDAFGLPVVPDVIDGYAGPLAGVLTGLEWVAENAPDCSWLATFATDAPFFPDDMVERMLECIEREKADMACAIRNGRTHPVFALWPLALKDDLRRAMVDEDMRKVDQWTSRYHIVHVEFADATRGMDPFFNINVAEQLAEAEHFINGGHDDAAAL